MENKEIHRQDVELGEDILLQHQQNHRDQSISFLKSTIGLSAYENIPRLDRSLLNRQGNYPHGYVGFVPSDLDHLEQKVAILEHNEFCISLVIKTENSLYSYTFEGTEISSCRHGRPLYLGSYSQHFAHYRQIFGERLHYIFQPLIDFLESQREGRDE